MNEANLIQQGLELMLFGMGTVVVFLTLLVFATTAMSALVQRFAPPAPDPRGRGSSTAGDSRLIAVISAALHQHRSRQKHD